MPNYRYGCLDCQKRFEIYMTYEEYGKQEVSCPQCHGQNVHRRIERIRFARSEESRLDDFADPSALEGLENDPRAMGRMMRQMSQEMGEDMGPEFDEVIGRLESGQSPEDIEAAMPELADEVGGLGSDDDF